MPMRFRIATADANHLVLTCKKYENGRDKLRKEIINSKCPLPANLNTIILHNKNRIYLTIISLYITT
ncbi:hypothetical protein O3M35_006044 [Rhynocoris fuscipes]|uniref:Uncharacterized protein n=1 Tax=Rhynocoris fuscipes TaxID=488301 RepID=A0AAW1DDJ1_9HEMI